MAAAGLRLCRANGLLDSHLNLITIAALIRFPSSSPTPQLQIHSTTKLLSRQPRWKFSKDRSHGPNQPEIKDLSKYEGPIDGQIEEGSGIGTCGDDTDDDVMMMMGFLLDSSFIFWDEFGVKPG